MLKTPISQENLLQKYKKNTFKGIKNEFVFGLKNLARCFFTFNGFVHSLLIKQWYNFIK